MKRIEMRLWAAAALSLTLSACSFLLNSDDAGYAESEFFRGVNLNEWFEHIDSAREINFGKFSEQDFREIKSLGAGIIRLPIAFHKIDRAVSDYTVDPLLFALLDQVVDWAEKYKMYIILDNHSSTGSNGATPEDIDRVLIPLWTQMADHFKNRSKFVLYEILNEPSDISTERWGAIQGEVIKAIRSKDRDHRIIVGGNMTSIESLPKLPDYADQNLLYAFHFYAPFVFTHQGASWGTPLGNLSGVPFPADPSSPPPIPEDIKGSGTWYERELINYASIGTEAALAAALDRVVSFSQSRNNAPVFCGEFGVYMPNAPAEDRVRWYRTVSRLLDERRIPRTSWDYLGGMGLYQTPQGGDFYADLNRDVVRALGFTPPAAANPEKIRRGFVIYDDYLARRITPSHWGTQSALDLYDPVAAEGKYAILWTPRNLYDAFALRFGQAVDWEYLRAQGYVLQFRARTERPARFDLRFMDDDGDSRIPWRMRYSIDAETLPPDGQWHTIAIPLQAMTEGGAWVGATQEWHTPQGLFSWDRIEELQVVAEHEVPAGYFLRFDSIQITKP